MHLIYIITSFALPTVICDVDDSSTFNEESDIPVHRNDHDDMRQMQMEIIDMKFF